MDKKLQDLAWSVLPGALWLIIISPIMVLGIIGEYCALLYNWLCDIFPSDWLKTKLRVYDTDPD